jgi:ParB family chromosome partitioning protein
MSEDKSTVKAATQRGLGRGLSALLGEVAEVQSNPSHNVSRETPIEMIHPNPNQPRRHFNREDLEALAGTIKEHGIVQPIVVRLSENGSGQYSIVAGERRWRAAQLAGLHRVPVVIRHFDDLETLKVAIVENLQRSNLNAIEEALAFEQLIDRFGYNQNSIADSVGRSRAYVANTIRLLALPPEVKEMVIHGTLSAGHARAALASNDPLKAANEMVARGLSVRDAEKLANRQPSNVKPASQKSQQDVDSIALSNDLSDSLGLEVEIKHSKKTGVGKLVLAYNNLEQLDELCRRLTKN